MKRLGKNLVNRRTGIAAAVVAIFGATVFLGCEFGSLNSPDYTTESSGARFMLSNAKPEIYEEDDGGVDMSLRAGVYLYRYSSKKPGEVRRELSPPWGGIAQIPRKWSTEELERVTPWLAGIGAAPAGILGSLAAFGNKVETYSRPARIWRYVAVAAVAGTGGIMGYYMTYSDTPDYDNANFSKGLENPSYWDRLALQVKAQVKVCQDVDILNDKQKFAALCEKFQEWMHEKAPLPAGQKS
jgi:hypothetical protein